MGETTPEQKDYRNRRGFEFSTRRIFYPTRRKQLPEGSACYCFRRECSIQRENYYIGIGQCYVPGIIERIQRKVGFIVVIFPNYSIIGIPGAQLFPHLLNIISGIFSLRYH